MTAQFIGIGPNSNLRQNALWLADELALFGIDCSPAPMQADTKEQLRQAIARALAGGRVAVLLGGLGLSENDFTLETLLEGLNTQTDLHESSMRRLQDYCRHHNVALPEDAQRAMRLPRSATAFPNPRGLFPGCAVASGSQAILMLPGEPAELQAMYDGSVFPFLCQFTGRSLIRRQVGVIGLSQPQAAERLEDLLAQQNPVLTIQPREGELALRVTAAGQNPAQAAAISAVTVKAIQERLGSCVYGVDVQSVGQVVASRLREEGGTMALAESGTGGRLAAAMAAQPEGRAAVAFQINASSAKAKVERLGIPAALLKEHGPVSETVALAMASAARKQGGAKLGLAVAGGSGGERENGPGVVYLALADDRNAWVKRLSVNSDNREFVRNVAVLQALNMARLYLDYYNEILPGAQPLGEALPAAKAGILAMLGLKNKKSPKSRGASGAQEELNLRKGTKKEGSKPFWTRFIPVKGDDKREIVRKSIFLVAVVVFLGSIGYIGSVFWEREHNKKLSGELSGLLGAEDYEIPDDYPEDYLTKFAALYDRNEDVAGWIKIDGTQVDYAVVQGKNNQYYERRDFDRKTNQHGVPFVDYKVDQKKPSTNTIIYAHNMNDGQMFGELMNYKSLAYYKEHPTFQYDSVYQENTYKIVGVFLVTADDPEFLYHMFVDAKDDAEMTWYVNQVRSRSLINTNVDVTTTDKLVTLSTCDYSFGTGNGQHVARFVVVGRAVREGEDAAVDVTRATLNTNPVMPKEWYDKIAQQQAEELKRQEEEMSRLAAEANNSATVWLTQAELDQAKADGLSDAEIGWLVEDRKLELSEWLSESEMNNSSLSAQDKLNLMEKRKSQAMSSNYKRFLTEWEMEDLSTDEKNRLVEERMAYAQQHLSDREINNARTWEELERLINEKIASAGNAELEDRYLTSAEKRLSQEEKDALISEREARARAAGVDPTKYSSWSRLLAAIEKAEANSSSSANAAEELRAKAEQAIDEADLSWLTNAERKALIEQLVKANQSQWDRIIRNKEKEKPASSTPEPPPSSSSAPDPSSSSRPDQSSGSSKPEASSSGGSEAPPPDTSSEAPVEPSSEAPPPEPSQETPPPESSDPPPPPADGASAQGEAGS